VRREKVRVTSPKRYLRFLLSKKATLAWIKPSGVALSHIHKEAHFSNWGLRKWFENLYNLHKLRFNTNTQFKTLELGSGGSQLKTHMPELMTSDILPIEGVDAVVDAQKMPFNDCSFANLTMINVLHHIPRPLIFFGEAQRVLIPGGRLVLTEPYVSPLSYFIYRFVHHETFDMKENILELGNGDSLLESNTAMPTQLLKKYSSRISDVAPLLKIKEIRYYTSLSYFLTGGVNYKSPLPYWLWNFFSKIDNLFCLLFGKYICSFFTIVFEKGSQIRKS
jgi:SAM-dependent methyltransferase